MNREYHRWFSPSLGREMELLVFGHAGARMLVFPTSKGKFYEWEDRGMIGALGHALENGHLQMYCVDSVDDESWYAWHKHPADRAWRHVQYEHYLLNEVLPLAYQKNQTPYLIVAGASFGAYHAMNFALRHPDITNRPVTLSLCVNGRLAYTLAVTNAGWRAIELAGTPEIWNEIEARVDRTWKPSAYGLNDDRPLGFAVRF